MKSQNYINGMPVADFCVECGEDVNLESFKDVYSKLEFSVSSICYNCQKTLEENDSPRKDNSPNQDS